MQAPPKDKLVKDDSGLLVWKANDRAVATFKSMTDIANNKAALAKLVQGWIRATENLKTSRLP